MFMAFFRADSIDAYKRENIMVAGCHIVISGWNTNDVLETGGRVFKSKMVLYKPGLKGLSLVNVNILTDRDLDLHQTDSHIHEKHKPLISFAVTSRTTSRYCITLMKMIGSCGRRNYKQTAEEKDSDPINLVLIEKVIKVSVVCIEQVSILYPLIPFAWKIFPCDVYLKTGCGSPYSSGTTITGDGICRRRQTKKVYAVAESLFPLTR
jgi:hypothetical protein